MDSDFDPYKLIVYKDGLFGLLLTDFSKIEGTTGAGCNGYRWQQVIQSQLKQMPTGRIDQLKFDSEADMFVVRSTDKDALMAVADVSRALLDDAILLGEAMTLAEPD